MTSLVRACDLIVGDLYFPFGDLQLFTGPYLAHNDSPPFSQWLRCTDDEALLLVSIDIADVDSNVQCRYFKFLTPRGHGWFCCVGNDHVTWVKRFRKV